MNNLGFWGQLKKPIWAIAPMANVTDSSLRQMIAKRGHPSVYFTEFVSARGLLSKGRFAYEADLYYTEVERPIVAQIFGNDPEVFFKCAGLLRKRGFDGIDINMGCPDKNVCKSGAGAALFKTPQLAQEIIRATQAGAGGLPVSAKIRTGWTQDATEDWVASLLKTNPAVITIHTRTKQQMSKVPADWGSVERAVKVRDQANSQALIVGNGDVMTLAQGQERVRQTGCDGVMFGRAIFGNPWLFAGQVRADIPVKYKLEAALEHTKLYWDLFVKKDPDSGGHKNFAYMKKHFKAYIDGFPGAKNLRIKLMATETVEEVRSLLEPLIRKARLIRIERT